MHDVQATRARGSSALSRLALASAVAATVLGGCAAEDTAPDEAALIASKQAVDAARSSGVLTEEMKSRIAKEKPRILSLYRERLSEVEWPGKPPSVDTIWKGVEPNLVDTEWDNNAVVIDVGIRNQCAWVLRGIDLAKSGKSVEQVNAALRASTTAFDGSMSNSSSIMKEI